MITTNKIIKYLNDKMKLNSDQWLYEKNTPDEFIIINRETKEKRVINKHEHNIETF